MSEHYGHHNHYNKLHIPDHWEHYWSKYPNGYTLLEALISWTSQVNDMITSYNHMSDDMVALDRNFRALDKELRASWAGYKDHTEKTYSDFREELFTILNNWIATIEPTIQDTVVSSLSGWLADGTLADIINNDVFDMKANQTDLDIVSAELTEQVTHVRNLSSLTENELRLLASDYNTHLHLNLDTDLIITGEPLDFTNTTFRTANGSKVVINDSSLVLRDNTDFQGIYVDARNSPTKPNIVIKRSPEAVVGYIKPITIDTVYIEGHPGFNANAFEIHGTVEGMFGLTIRNLYTRDHNIIFDFYFGSYDAWTNANVFENVFAMQMKQIVNYRAYGVNHPAGTHFTSNLFSNVGGNGSVIYRKLSHDPGYNRYLNCFVYDLEQHNNKPDLNRVGLIRGVNNSSFLMEYDETPAQLLVRNQNVLLLGYFDNTTQAPLEAFLKLSFLKAGVGIETIIWLSRDAEGNLIVKNKQNTISGWYNFYTATADDGSMAVYVHYTGSSWMRPKYHDRNDFTISHMGGMIYTKSQIDAIPSISEKVSVTSDATIF